jgi:glucan endo-1,3-beta-D-glucosidase
MIVTPPVLSFDRVSLSVPVPVPSSPSPHLTNFPIPSSIPADPRGAFETPRLLVSIEKANPGKVVGNGFTAQLSLTISTVFVFDVHSEHKGKLCNLVFYMPPAIQFDDLAPIKIRKPGGINLSRLSNRAATPEISANSAGDSTLVGTVPLIQPANNYTVSSTPCEAGKRVWYQVDSIGGLSMDFFQTILPPLGLFMIPV